MGLKKLLSGNSIDRMPDLAFRMMAFIFRIYYFFRPAGKYLEQFGIEPGFTVVDYGCGPGAFIKNASERAGTGGKVYAVDVHELAIGSVRRIILKYQLTNVIPVLSDGAGSDMPAGIADLIYALDMFHMVKDKKSFLLELRRISKPDATLILEDGHQPRSLTRQKIQESGCWRIIEENRRFVRCKP